MKKFLLSGLAFAAFAVGPAIAADMPVKAAPFAPVPIWTGFYLGAGAGYSWGQVETGAVANPDAAALRPKGAFAVLQGGYDYQFSNNVVLGVRLTVPILGMSDSRFSPVAGTNIETRARSAVLLGTRLGYAMGNWMPYVLGGFVWARGEGTSVGCCTVRANHTGGFIGGGIETLIARNWSVELNYSYVSVGKSDYDFTPFGGSVLQYGYNSHNLTAAVNYRF